MEKYQDHPIAALFPLMSESELQELAEDIRARGLKDDIVIHQSRILDGRNRYRACLLADVEPRVKPYVGTEPIKDVLSWNLHRRHLTTSQRAMVATAVPDVGGTGERAQTGRRKKGAAITNRRRGVCKFGTGDEPEENTDRQVTRRPCLCVSPPVATAKKVQQAAPELAER